jgi:hypothetical protein
MKPTASAIISNANDGCMLEGTAALAPRARRTWPWPLSRGAGTRAVSPSSSQQLLGDFRPRSLYYSRCIAFSRSGSFREPPCFSPGTSASLPRDDLTKLSASWNYFARWHTATYCRVDPCSAPMPAVEPRLCTHARASGRPCAVRGRPDPLNLLVVSVDTLNCGAQFQSGPRAKMQGPTAALFFHVLVRTAVEPERSVL